MGGDARPRRADRGDRERSAGHPGAVPDERDLLANTVGGVLGVLGVLVALVLTLPATLCRRRRRRRRQTARWRL
jgi:hypothetical protein